MNFKEVQNEVAAAFDDEKKCRDNSSLIAGRLESIEVEKFMCHNHLKVNFDPCMTVITGRNGEGKSAIVAALQVALQRSANETGRGSRLEDLIQSTSDGPAVVRVTLSNCGPGAFEHDRFGDSITIERRLFRTSTASASVLYNSRGHQVCTAKAAKDTLKALSTHFQLMPDSPVCILTQTDAKDFLCGSAGSKYGFFLRATGLDEAKKENDELLLSVEGLKDDVDCERRKDCLYENEVQVTREVVGMWTALDKNDEKISSIQCQLAWKVMDNRKGELSSLHDDVDDKLEIIHEAEISISAIDENIKTIDGNSNLSELATRMTNAVHEARSVRVGHENDFRNAKKTIALIDVEIRRISHDISSKRDDMTGLRQSIDQVRSRSNEAELILLTNKRNDVMRRMSDVDGRLRGMEDIGYDDNDRSTNIRSLESSLQTMRLRMGELSSSSSSSSKKSSSSSLSLYGDSMVTIVQQIHSSRFTGPVIGPLGDYIRIKDDGVLPWMTCIEKTIGRVLSSFLVTNTHDRAMLEGILSRNRSSLEIHVSDANMTRYNRSEFPTFSRDMVTINDLLTVSHDAAFNVLIDVCRIESVIVTESESVAVSSGLIITGRSGSDEYGHNGISTILTKDGTSIIVKNGFRRAQPHNSRFVNRACSVLKLKDPGDVEKEFAAERSRLSIEIDDASLQLRNEMRMNEERNMQMKRAGDDRRRVEGDKRVLAKELTRLEQQIEDAKPVSTMADEARLNEMDRALAGLSDRLSQVTRQRDDSREAEADLQAALDQARQVEDDLTRRQGEMEGQLMEKRRQKEELIKNKEAASKSLRSAQSTYETSKQKYDVLSSWFQDRETELISKWPDMSTRIHAKLPYADWNTSLSVSQLQTRQLGLESHRANMMKELGREGRLHAEARYAQAMAKLREHEARIGELVGRHGKLSDDYITRQKKWDDELISQSENIKTKFQTIMRRRGDDGLVAIDHDRKMLDIRVRPSDWGPVDDGEETEDDDDEDDGKKKKKKRKRTAVSRQDVEAVLTQSVGRKKINKNLQLSGGEKSFSTLALLISISMASECPFKIMDEVDVFMDIGTRRLAMDEISEFSRPKNDVGEKMRQVILLTPQNVQTVKDDEQKYRTIELSRRSTV